jgi:hypothetical protein
MNARRKLFKITGGVGEFRNVYPRSLTHTLDLDGQANHCPLSVDSIPPVGCGESKVRAHTWQACGKLGCGVRSKKSYL